MESFVIFFFVLIFLFLIVIFFFIYKNNHKNKNNNINFDEINKWKEFYKKWNSENLNEIKDFYNKWIEDKKQLDKWKIFYFQWFKEPLDKIQNFYAKWNSENLNEIKDFFTIWNKDKNNLENYKQFHNKWNSEPLSEMQELHVKWKKEKENIEKWQKFYQKWIEKESEIKKIFEKKQGVWSSTQDFHKSWKGYEKSFYEIYLDNESIQRLSRYVSQPKNKIDNTKPDHELIFFKSKKDKENNIKDFSAIFEDKSTDNKEKITQNLKKYIQTLIDSAIKMNAKYAILRINCDIGNEKEWFDNEPCFKRLILHKYLEDNKILFIEKYKELNVIVLQEENTWIFLILLNIYNEFCPSPNNIHEHDIVIPYSIEENQKTWNAILNFSNQILTIMPAVSETLNNYKTTITKIQKIVNHKNTFKNIENSILEISELKNTSSKFCGKAIAKIESCKNYENEKISLSNKEKQK